MVGLLRALCFTRFSLHFSSGSCCHGGMWQQTTPTLTLAENSPRISRISLSGILDRGRSAPIPIFFFFIPCRYRRFAVMSFQVSFRRLLLKSRYWDTFCLSPNSYEPSLAFGYCLGIDEFPSPIPKRFQTT